MTIGDEPFIDGAASADGASEDRLPRVAPWRVSTRSEHAPKVAIAGEKTPTQARTTRPQRRVRRIGKGEERRPSAHLCFAGFFLPGALRAVGFFADEVLRTIAARMRALKALTSIFSLS